MMLGRTKSLAVVCDANRSRGFEFRPKIWDREPAQTGIVMEQKISLIARDLELFAHENSEGPFTKACCKNEGQQDCEKPVECHSGAWIGGWVCRRKLHSMN